MSIILLIIIVVGVLWLATKSVGLLIGVLIAGLVGWAASSIMGGNGAGLLGNIALGLVGGLIGPVILSLVNVNPDNIIIGGILSSLLGAVIVIGAARMMGFKGFAK